MESYYNYRNRMMRISVRQYFHFVYYHPRVVCRIIASLNVVFFMALSSILVCNIFNAVIQQSSTFKSSSDEVTIGLDLKAPVGLVYKNEDKVITKSFINLSFTATMLVINVRLQMATYKRNLCSISLWLFVHTTHMLYTLSINLWVGVTKAYNLLICLALLNTLLYLLFISLVALFWMEQRCNIRNPVRTNDKAATNQERMA